MFHKYLQLEGANIFIEIEGNGPYIVFVAGANGDTKVFKPLRTHLVKHFTVVLYDRRGYSNSILTVPQDYTKHLDQDVDDLYKIMKSITDKKYIIFGFSSSGAIVLQYTLTHPDTFSKCIVFEPLVDLKRLDVADEIQLFHEKTYNLFKKEGTYSAIKAFGKKYFNKLDNDIIIGKSEDRFKKKDNLHSWNYWLEYEWREYSFARFDTKKLAIYKDKLVLLYGVQCFESFIYKPVEKLAEDLEHELIPFPGGHIGFYTEAELFAASLIKLCEDHILLINHSQPQLLY